MLLSLAVNNDYAVFQFDVETAFLYGNIDTNIFVSQVLGFEDPDPEKEILGMEVAEVTVQNQTGSSNVESSSGQNTFDCGIFSMYH